MLFNRRAVCFHTMLHHNDECTGIVLKLAQHFMNVSIDINLVTIFIYQ